MIRILVVDEESRLAAEVRAALTETRIKVFTVSTDSGALRLLRRERMDVVIVGLELADMEGVEFLTKVKTSYPLVEVIMIVGHSSVDDVVRYMKSGAHDCVSKPTRLSQLSQAVLEAYETKRLRTRGACVTEERDGIAGHDQFIGKSKQILEVKRLISLVAPSDTPVLVLGETGTGKELAARAIHMESGRRSGPFVAVNASTLPENILESELFGYKKGAFTGAESNKTGLVEAAHGGTFFIDEVGDMEPAVQAKLLRVIETGTFRKLGDTREMKVDVRFVSATNKELVRPSGLQRFRTDLFYRLSTIVISIPPLRQRPKDIPLLADYFLSRGPERGVPRRISSEALARLMTYSWPGNVRELANTIERAVLLSKGAVEIDADTLPLRILQAQPSQLLEEERKRFGGSIVLQDIERQYVREILGATAGNKSLAARLLGISRATLYRRLYEL